MQFHRLAALAVFAAATTAAADLVVTVEDKDLKSDPPSVETQMFYMTTDKLAADGQDTEGGKVTMIYRGDRGLLWTVDHGSKAYVELDQATMQKMGGELDAAMQQMQEQMAKMPEEQRKMVESMMQKNAGANKKKPVVEIHDSGAKQTIEGKTCSRYDMTVDGTKTAELFVASWKEVGLPKDSFAAFRSMIAFLQSLVDASPALANAIGKHGTMFLGLDRVEDCLVLVRQLEDGAVVEETLFKSVQEQKLEASRFEVPSGYAKQSIGP